MQKQEERIVTVLLDPLDRPPRRLVAPALGRLRVVEPVQVRLEPVVETVNPVQHNRADDSPGREAVSLERRGEGACAGAETQEQVVVHPVVRRDRSRQHRGV